jgi:predicted protein tyrosine phosphatase
MKILFVCSANVNRSVTAEFMGPFFNPKNIYDSAGSSEFACNKYGGTLVSSEQLTDANVIYCMENRNKKEINNRFGDQFDSKIKVLDIKDEYQIFDRDLIFELSDKIDW